MSTQPVMFTDAPEDTMTPQSKASLDALRNILSSISPSNVVPESTWTRRDMGGYDFVMPHRVLGDFSLVARMSDEMGDIALAYSGCKRKDRGDEFDAAFGRDGMTVQTVIYNDGFLDALNETLLGYLQRKLRFVQYLNRDEEVIKTEIFWPGQQSDTLLWESHVPGVALRKRTSTNSTIAFDEPS
jgi:hypothetical protein